MSIRAAAASMRSGARRLLSMVGPPAAILAPCPFVLKPRRRCAVALGPAGRRGERAARARRGAITTACSVGSRARPAHS